MFRFVTRIFAIVGFVVTLLLVVGIALLLQEQKPPAEPDSVILVINFDQPIVEQNEPSPLDLAMHDNSTSLPDLLHAIAKAKNDPHVKGIVGRFGSEQPSLAQTQEVSAALKDFRSSGKFTAAFGTDYGEFGMGNRAYLLASAFEAIWLQPVGTVGLTGLAIELPFAKTALDKIGVTADFMQREEYKSFMDMATRDDWAPPVRANMQSLIDDMAEQEAKGIADNRGLDVAKVKDLMAKGPYTDDEALKAGLVTHVGYADQLDKELEQKVGKESKDVDVGVYLDYVTPEKTGGTKIALIHGDGLIMDNSSGAGGLTGEKILGADQLAAAFDQAAEDKDVKAILFRIDSPGGSPEASETIRRAVIHAQKSDKQVFVSMGGTAASGGYWIAMNANYIAAEPGTLTGSIGVLGGKFTGGGLLQKLGVNVGSLKTAENAGMWSPTETFTPAQRERVNAMLDNAYHAFTKNVSEARKIPIEKMPDIAKGRVWTGQQALKIGLVDDLGGYDVTLAAIRKNLNLAPTDPLDLEPFPAPESPIDRVLKMLKTFGVEGAMVRVALLQWQSMQSVIAPLLGDALTGSPVQAITHLPRGL